MEEKFTMNSRVSKRKKKKWPWIVGIIGALVLGVVVFGAMIFKNLTDTAERNSRTN